MAYQIIVTEDFEKSIAETIDWLNYNWSIVSVIKFETKLKAAIHKISLNPKIGLVSNRQNDIRSLSITKHNRLYYQVFENQVALLKLVESKQNPSKNKYE